MPQPALSPAVNDWRDDTGYEWRYDVDDDQWWVWDWWDSDVVTETRH